MTVALYVPMLAIFYPLWCTACLLLAQALTSGEDFAFYCQLPHLKKTP